MSCFKAHYYFSCSSFNDHLGYKLSKGEVDNILKRKLKYKWELPAFDILNCKWIGTGERLQKVCLPPIVHYNVLYYNPFIPSCIYLLPSCIWNSGETNDKTFILSVLFNVILLWIPILLGQPPNSVSWCMRIGGSKCILQLPGRGGGLDRCSKRLTLELLKKKKIVNHFWGFCLRSFV